MTDSGMRTSALRSRFLQIHSSHDIHVDSKTHNPANFEISMPNSTISNGVVRVVPHTVSIPRVFYNVYAPHNVVDVWRRKTKVTEIGVNDWMVTGEPEWTKITLTVPPGLYTPATLMTAMNNNGWGDHVFLDYNTSTKSMAIINPTYTYWEWNHVFQPEQPPAPPIYMPQMYITEPEGTHFFDVLGLGLAQFVPNGDHWLSYEFDPNRAETGDSIRGTEIEKAKIIVPMFKTNVHNMEGYLWVDYTAPTNPLNLEGPVNVSVVIDGIGDNASIDAETGKPSDIITQVPMTSSMYTYSTRTVQDCDAEAIQYQSERTLRGFRVRLQDAEGATLTLPRNWPVHIRLQILQTQ